MRKFDGTIVGTMPIHINRYMDALDVEEEIGKKPRDLTKVDAWRRKEAELRVYANGKGLYLPGRNIRSAMVEGSRVLEIRHKVQGRAKALWPFLRRGLVVEPTEVLFNKKKADGLHKDMVRIPPRTGALVPKYWPRLDEWKLSFSLVVFDDALTREELEESLKAAGLFCGLGTNRPDYGKFELTEFAEAAA